MNREVISMVPTDFSPQEAYRLFLSVVVPRPIAWVSTLGADGTPNLAPFSFFNGVAGNPLTLLLSVGRRAGGPKDTLRNATETREMVIHLVTPDTVRAMNVTSGEYSYGVNEIEKAGLTAVPSVDVKPPRVAEAAVAMECKVSQIVPVEGTGSTLILGRVVRFHIREDLLRPDHTVDAAKLQPVARLSGDEYASFGEVFHLRRPVV